MLRAVPHRLSRSTFIRLAASVAATSALLAFAHGAQAQSLAVKGGTTGLGAEFSYGISSMFAVRAGLNGGSYSRSFTESEIRYEGDVNFSSSVLTADFHPFSGGFRLSAGAMLNNNKFEADGQGQGGTIVINGVPYPAAAVGSVKGTVEFERFSPYLGIGWGSAPKGSAGLFVAVDLGAVFQKPKSTLVGTCGPSLPADICAQLQSDLRAEEAEFQDAIDSALKIYPKITLGIGYRF
jgi:hypothetical protein